MSFEVRAEKKKKKQQPSTSLPDDVMFDILARVPRCNYPTLALISKHFRSLVSSPDLYERRILLDCTEACIYVVLFNTDTSKYHLYILLHTANNEDNRLVLIGSLPSMLSNALFVAVGSRIYALSGIYNRETTSSVLSIDCRSHTVQTISSIPKPMDNAVVGIIDEKIYVIGKCMSGSSSKKVVVVYDTKTQLWEEHGMIEPNMKVGDMLSDSIVMADKMYMKDSHNTFVYDSKERKWKTNKILNSKKWEFGCVMDDVLYYYDSRQKELRVYDPNKKCWEAVKGVEKLSHEVESSWGLETVNYGGKLVVLLYEIEPKICCAEIAIEICESQGKISGKVEWCDVVFSGKFVIMKSLVVTV